MRSRTLSAVLAGLLLGMLVMACGGGEPPADLVLAPESELPQTVLSQPEHVREAYRFAIANQELLEQIPCFCGCNGVGHTSNFSCYVADDGGPGPVAEFEYHAVG